jgi:hypothetical protein
MVVGLRWFDGDGVHDLVLKQAMAFCVFGEIFEKNSKSSALFGVK